MPDIAKRFPENPIVRPQDIRPSLKGMKVECLLNPGVFRYQGKTWLLVRVAERPEQKAGIVSLPVLESDGSIRILEFDKSDPKLDDSDPRSVIYDGQAYLSTLSHLRLISSQDGIHFSEDPTYPVLHGQGENESFGIEDCRVTQLGNTYYLTFTAVSHSGPAIGMRSTTDWRKIVPRGLILPPHNKDCAIVDQMIDGKYYAFHRPTNNGHGGKDLWVSESPDLEHWGHHRCAAKTRRGMWDNTRIGAGAAPIRTEEGWLAIYHGVNQENRYCLGAMLFDLKQPWKILARSEEPIMEPTASYEQTGFFGNVVFTNGQLVDGDQITVYYGASDCVIGGARFSVSEVLGTLKWSASSRRAQDEFLPRALSMV